MRYKRSKFRYLTLKMVTKFKGLGLSCDVMLCELVAKVCLPLVTFST